jgi:heterodisulfide reductase subunit C2
LATSEVIVLTSVKRDPAFGDHLIPAGHQLSTCIQCGTCTASCPSARAMDITPRQMWRMVQLGLVDEVLHSKTMWLCSVCYQCQARCPRGIPLTETIAKLKQLAIQQQVKEWHESTTFYLAFAGVMRRYGRMREMEFMARYFMSTNPMEALGYATMGLTLFRRGKIRPEMPRLVGKGRLDDLFDRVAELEKKQ